MQQISLRLDSALRDAYDLMAADRHRRRSDVIRDALHAFTDVHAPAAWYAATFGRSKHEAVQGEVLTVVAAWRASWIDRDPGAVGRRETATMIHALAATLAELWLTAREVHADVGVHAGAARAGEFREVAEQLDRLTKPLFELARAIARDGGNDLRTEVDRL